jgi:hypothetical protein
MGIRTSEIEHEELCVSEHGQRGRGQEPECEAVEKRVAWVGMRKGRGDEGPAGKNETGRARVRAREWVSCQLRGIETRGHSEENWTYNRPLRRFSWPFKKLSCNQCAIHLALGGGLLYRCAGPYAE